MTTLDIFRGDAFSMSALIEAINTAPAVPSMVRDSGLFLFAPLDTTSYWVERRGDALALVSNSQRGAPARHIVSHPRRTGIEFQTAHLVASATILADEIQNRRAFGRDAELETIEMYRSERLAMMRADIDATLEWQLVGAIKGQVLDADGVTVIADIFSAFGVTQQVKAMELNTDTTDVQTKIIQAKRLSEATLGAARAAGWVAFCGPDFFDAFVGHPETKAAFDRWMQGELLRGDPRSGFMFGGVEWKEYSGEVTAGSPFVPAAEAYLCPVGVPGLFSCKFAPADWIETVNKPGLPLHARAEPLDMGRGVALEAQSNPAALCTRPRSVIKLTIA